MKVNNEGWEEAYQAWLVWAAYAAGGIHIEGNEKYLQENFSLPDGIPDEYEEHEYQQMFFRALDKAEKTSHYPRKLKKWYKNCMQN